MAKGRAFMAAVSRGNARFHQARGARRRVGRRGAVAGRRRGRIGGTMAVFGFTLEGKRGEFSFGIVPIPISVVTFTLEKDREVAFPVKGAAAAPPGYTNFRPEASSARRHVP